MTEHGGYGLILRELDSLRSDIHRIEDKVEALLIDVAMLKVKAGIWGAVAGLIPASVAVILSVVWQ